MLAFNMEHKAHQHSEAWGYSLSGLYSENTGAPQGLMSSFCMLIFVCVEAVSWEGR